MCHLNHLQEREPRCIYIETSKKMIGKECEKVQIYLPYEGVSRIHALVYKDVEKTPDTSDHTSFAVWMMLLAVGGCAIAFGGKRRYI